MANGDNDSEKKKMSAKDIAFIIFLILFMICVLALITMTVGMSRGWWSGRLNEYVETQAVVKSSDTTATSGKLNKVGAKLGIIADEPQAVIKSSVTIATSGATVIFALVLAIIYFTKKEKTSTQQSFSHKIF